MLSKDDIERYLEEISRTMEHEGIRGEIVLCGGAVMTMVYDARPSTKDIDALFEPAAKMRTIAAEIAERDGLESDWLNDGAKGFIDTSRIAVDTVRDFGALLVKAPNARGMLALKLTSAREDSKDAADALFLMEYLGIESEEELFEIIEQNIAPQRLTPLAGFFAKEMYRHYRAAQ